MMGMNILMMICANGYSTIHPIPWFGMPRVYLIGLLLPVSFPLIEKRRIRL